LEGTDDGIVSVTPENLNVPSLSFEAGAIAKRVGQGRATPFLFGMPKLDVPAGNPLGHIEIMSYEIRRGGAAEMTEVGSGDRLANRMKFSPKAKNLRAIELPSSRLKRWTSLRKAASVNCMFV
jgi:hypothetical protein